MLQAAFVEAVRRIVGKDDSKPVIDALKDTLRTYRANELAQIASAQHQVCLADIAEAVYYAQHPNAVPVAGTLLTKHVFRRLGG